MGTPKGEVLAALGAPTTHDEASVSYALPNKPGYTFKFAFDAMGQLIKAQFVLALSEGRASPGDLSRQTIKRLSAIGATEEEVRAWYGEPDEILGWWPIETWSYGEMQFDLRLGIVV